MVKTENRRGKKRILWEEEGQTLLLTGWGKFDNPRFCRHRGRSFVFWEEYGEGVRIGYGLIEEGRIASSGYLNGADSRCYRPRPVSDGENLIVCYERFLRGHYVITGNLWQGRRRGFGPAAVLGEEDRNNQEPCLLAGGVKGEFFLAYENSSPLYRNYVWISPRGDRVVIPGFGHGWRVETRAFFKKLTLSGSGSEEDPRRIALASGGTLPLDGSESAGCPRLFWDDRGGLNLLFLTRGDRAWKVLSRRFDGQGWTPPEDTGVIQDLRIPPEPPREGIGPGGPADIPMGGLNQSAPPIKEKIRPENRPEISYEGESQRLFWGDLHMHTNISVCSLHPRFHCTELEEKYRQCRDVGRLDFAMVTDHDVMSDKEWERTRNQADFHNRPGVFTAFVGFEWTATQRAENNQGHYNVLYKDTGRLYRVDEEDGDHITKLWADLTEGEALTIPHHPADETHTLDWGNFDSRFEPLVEIFQVRGSYEYPGNPHDPSRYRPEKMVPGASILEALEKGFRFGFTSGGEHEGVGVTAVYARENTREALFEALRRRRVYGTTGDRIFVDFRVCGELMGGEITLSPDGEPVIRAVVRGTAPIKELRIMRDGKKVFSRAYPSGEAELEWTDVELPRIRGERDVHYYYLALEQENGEAAWASPVFIT